MATAASVWAYPIGSATTGQRMASAASLNAEVHRISGLDAAAPLSVSSAARTAGSITQVITQSGETTEVARSA